MKSLGPALLLAAIASACVTTPAPRSQPCTGTPVLELRNETSSEVELVESRRGSGARVVIGIFGPGTHTVNIRSDPAYTYSTRFSGGRVATAESAPRRGDGSVGTRRYCLDS